MSAIRCITCTNFTLRPREGDQAHLAASDRAHARVGMGRCLKETLLLRWESAEKERQCDRHEPVSEEQAAARREWIKGRRA